MAHRLTEAEFLAWVLAAAKRLGWKTAHFGNTVKLVRRGGQAVPIPDKEATGFPDLVLARHGRLAFAELKSDTGKLAFEQDAWLAALREVEDTQLADRPRATPACAIEVYVWRPRDADEVLQVLK